MTGPQVRFGTEAKIYNKHLINVKGAKAKVDNHAPRLPIKAYVKEANFFGDLNRLRSIELQNREMLKLINIIYRSKGKTNCHLEHYKRPKTAYLLEQAFLKKQRDRIETFLAKLDLKNVKSTYNQQDSLKDWKKALKVMRSSARYPEFYDKKRTVRSWSICPRAVITYQKSHKVCYWDLRIGDLPKLFRVEIEVYRDVVPGTSENFVQLCSGFQGLTYKGTVFHRIATGLFCLGGDVVNRSGTGGTSIYGPSFPDENHLLEHNGPGVLSMYTNQPDKNNSQFLLTFKTLTSLNGKCVVFGKVISNLKTLQLIESCGTKSGKPQATVRIEECGVF